MPLGICGVMLTREVLEAPLTAALALFPWPGCQGQLGHSVVILAAGPSSAPVTSQAAVEPCWVWGGCNAPSPCSLLGAVPTAAGVPLPCVLWRWPHVLGRVWPLLLGSHRPVSRGWPPALRLSGARAAGWERGRGSAQPWGAVPAVGPCAAAAPPHACSPAGPQHKPGFVRPWPGLRTERCGPGAWEMPSPTTATATDSSQGPRSPRGHTGRWRYGPDSEPPCIPVPR